MSNSKGFWGGVTVTPQAVTEERDSYKVTPLVTPLLDAYKSVINYTRNLYLRIPTKSGRPSKGPRFLCVTQCTYENEYGLTSSAETKGRRWACQTCFSLCVPVWSDGPIPDIEDIEQEWADWAAKQKPSSAYAQTRERLGVK